MSHVVKVDVKMKNLESVKQAAKAIGARVIGMVEHSRFGSGMSIHLNGWQFPIVIDSNGTAAFDNYGGRWGDEKELTKLTEAYALATAQKVAQDQGWYAETDGNKLTIYHPTGGVVTVEGGTIEASNFSGGSCMKATEEIEKALGIESSRSLKPEFNLTEVDQTNL